MNKYSENIRAEAINVSDAERIVQAAKQRCDRLLGVPGESYQEKWNILIRVETRLRDRFNALMARL